MFPLSYEGDTMYGVYFNKMMRIKQSLQNTEKHVNQQYSEILLIKQASIKWS